MSGRWAALRMLGMLAAILAPVCLPASARAQDVFTGEIRCVGFDWAPFGWAKCDGQLLLIEEYPALYDLIGTNFGGDGQTTFGLPDLRGRVAVGAGTSDEGLQYTYGQALGQEYVSLTAGQMPAHNHSVWTDDGLASTDTPTGRLHSRDASGVPHYGNWTLVPMESDAVEPAGSSQPHENRPPYLVNNYIIALDFTTPTPNAPSDLPRMEPAPPPVPRIAP